MSEPVQIDLATLLGVLDREQLQALVVQLIIRDPTGRVFDMLEQATEFLDHEQLLMSLEPLVDITNNLLDLDTAIQPFRARYEGYMKLQLHQNALVVLYAYSNQVIMNMIEGGIDTEDEILKQMVIDIENDWKAIAEVYTLSEKAKLELEQAEKDKVKKLDKMAADEKKKKQKGSGDAIHAQKATDRVLTSDNTISTGKKGKKFAEMKQAMDEEADMEDYIPQVEAPMTLMKIFEQLATWRQQLQALGPIFGDALRLLKLRIVAETETAKEAPIVTAQPTVEPTAPTVQKPKTSASTVPMKQKSSMKMQGAIKRKSPGQPDAVKKAKR